MLTAAEQRDIVQCLWRHPRMGREEVIEFQNQRLRRLIADTYRDVPYYRRLFDSAGVKPDDIQTADDLPALPITTKPDLKAAPLEDILARGVDPDRLLARKTSGSSGEPFIIRHTRDETNLLNQFRIRSRKEAGVLPGDRTATIVERAADVPWTKKLGDSIRAALGRGRWYNISCHEPPEKIVSRLEEIGPDVISGYPATLADLATIVASGEHPRIKPRLITTGAETLAPPFRKRIEEGFGARVFDSYGAHEFNLIAWECPESGQYHVCDDSVILEVLKNGKPAGEGEVGQVVITSLHSFAMPFIRYPLGDVVVRGGETCPCGRPFSTLLAIRGRILETFLLPGGRRIHPYEISGPCIFTPGYDWIEKFQVIQEKIDHIVFRLATARPPRDDELERVREAAREILGPEVRVQVDLVESSDFEQTGKFRIYRSRVTADSLGEKDRNGLLTDLE